MVDLTSPIVKEFVEHLFINRYIDILFANEIEAKKLCQNDNFEE